MQVSMCDIITVIGMLYMYDGSKKKETKVVSLLSRKSLAMKMRMNQQAFHYDLLEALEMANTPMMTTANVTMAPGNKSSLGTPPMSCSSDLPCALAGLALFRSLKSASSSSSS